MWGKSEEWKGLYTREGETRRVEEGVCMVVKWDIMVLEVKRGEEGNYMCRMKSLYQDKHKENVDLYSGPEKLLLK